MNLKRSLLFSAAAVVTAIFALNAFAESREWTQAATGNKIPAEYLGMKDDATVELKLGNGSVAAVPVASLSPEDQAFIKSQNMAPETAEETAEQPAGKLSEGETTVTISGVHLCCRGCEEGVEESLVTATEEDGKDLEGVELEISRKEGTVVVKAPSGQKAKTALAAISSGGFWGTSDNSALEVPYKKGGADITTDVMTVKDMHFCCGSCVKAFEKALKEVKGVEETTAKEGSSSAKITGEGFVPSEVSAALRAAGFGGTWQ